MTTCSTRLPASICSEPEEPEEAAALLLVSPASRRWLSRVSCLKRDGIDSPTSTMKMAETMNLKSSCGVFLVSGRRKPAQPLGRPEASC